MSEKTVADSMRRQGLVARRIRRRNGLTRQDKTAAKFPDLLKRDFTAAAPNSVQLPSGRGKPQSTRIVRHPPARGAPCKRTNKKSKGAPELAHR